MEKILIISLIVLSFHTIKAQEVEFKFKVDSGELTEIKFECEGKVFDVYTIGDGINYVKCISAEGEKFACWLGYPTEFIYKKYPVWTSKDGTEFCFFLLNKEGYPYSVWLEKVE